MTLLDTPLKHKEKYNGRKKHKWQGLIQCGQDLFRQVWFASLDENAHVVNSRLQCLAVMFASQKWLHLGNHLIQSIIRQN
jgi:hypothetical protein